MNQATPIPLRNANDEPVAKVIEELEHALVLARRGEMREVAIIGQLTGGRTFSAFDTRDIPALCCQLLLLQHNMLAKMRETSAPA